MGSDLDFKKLAVERAYRNGFYFGISWTIAGEIWGLVTALVIWHTKAWLEHISWITTSSGKLRGKCSSWYKLLRKSPVLLWDQTRENGRCGHHSFKLMPDQMFPLNDGKTLQPWLPSTNVPQVICTLVFIQGTCVRVLSVLISTSLFVFPRKPKLGGSQSKLYLPN